MKRALELAERAYTLGEAPIGALVVFNGNIVSEAFNLRETMNDPTAHAEILAMRQAGKILGSWRLLGCSLYVTLEPCVMCTGCIVQARIPKLVYAAHDLKGGACGSRYNLLTDDVKLLTGIGEEQSLSILRRFFSERR